MGHCRVSRVTRKLLRKGKSGLRRLRDTLRGLAGVATGRDQPAGAAIFSSDKSVLIVEGAVPAADQAAGDRNIIEFIRTLRGDGWTVAFWPMSPEAPEGYVRALVDLGVTVVLGRYRPTLARWLREQGRNVRQVIVCRPDVAQYYLPTLLALDRAHITYYGHDLHFARMEMEANLTQDAALLAAAAEMRREEISIWEQVDVALYPTQDEADKAGMLSPQSTVRHVQIFCFDDFSERAVAPQASEILFVAGFRHAPNVDAAIWFCETILPKVIAAVPGTKLTVIGSRPPKEVLDLGSEHVDVRGWVSDTDLVKAYGTARVAVVPLRFGAGLKLKVVEALAYGTPLVTTEVGAQGLDGLPAIVPVENEPEALAEAIIGQLTQSDTDWLKRSAAQVAFAQARFSRQTMLQTLQAAFASPKRRR